MIWLLIYLAVGLGNCTQYALRRGFLFQNRINPDDLPPGRWVMVNRRADRLEEAFEVLFYLLLWPTQVIFWVWTCYPVLWVTSAGFRQHQREVKQQREDFRS